MRVMTSTVGGNLTNRPQPYDIYMSLYFFALVATSFGHYGHHPANAIQKFKEAGYIWYLNILRGMGSHLH